MKTIERRIRRSRVVGNALNYQLQACSERAGSPALLLTARHGLVIAKSPARDIPVDSIAAQMASVGTNQFRITTVTCGSRPCVVSAKGFHSDGEEFVLCAVGNPNERTLGQMHIAIGGIRRILAQNSRR